MPADPQNVQQLVGRAIEELGASNSALLVHIGDKLGLYKMVAESGPLTSRELAERTSTAERYVREWLSNQVAGGYVSYEPAGQRFYMTEEQKACFADESSPTFMLGGFESIVPST